MRAQVTRTLDNLEVVLARSDSRLADVVRLNYFTTDVGGLFEAWDAVAGRLATAQCRPASTLLGVAQLAFPELLIEIEATALVSI
jgi:enamine deaminase RidA (YjgF/YER057c/UK114 family)